MTSPHDIHRKTAACIFGVDELQVTPEQRKIGQMANFPALYARKPVVQEEQSVGDRIPTGMPELDSAIGSFTPEELALEQQIQNFLEDCRKVAGSLPTEKGDLPEIGGGFPFETLDSIARPVVSSRGYTTGDVIEMLLSPPQFDPRRRRKYPSRRQRRKAIQTLFVHQHSWVMGGWHCDPRRPIYRHGKYKIDLPLYEFQDKIIPVLRRLGLQRRPHKKGPVARYAVTDVKADTFTIEDDNT